MHSLPSNLPSIIQSASPLVSQYGYLAVGLLLLLESLGLPLIPGETTLIAGSLFAGIGRLNILIVILTAVVASVAGSSIGYWIGTVGGRKVIVRYGKYVLIDEKRLKKLEKFFNNRGGLVVVIARFIDGLRQLNGIIAGASNMTWSKFIRYNIVGAVLWVAAWTSVGYYGGSHLGFILKYEIYLAIALASALIIYVLFLIIRSKRRRSGRSKEA